jgi:hypothetical protein
MPQYALQLQDNAAVQGAELEVPPFGVFVNGGESIAVQMSETEAAGMSRVPGLVVTKTSDDNVANFETPAPFRVDWYEDLLNSPDVLQVPQQPSVVDNVTDSVQDEPVQPVPPGGE